MLSLKLPIAFAAAVLLAGTANATVITVDPSNIGASYTVSYDGFADGSVINGLGGEATFTLTGATANSYTFAYSVENTSSAPIDTSRISIFGFNTDPSISGATSTGDFSIVATNANVPSGFGQVDVCFKGGGGSNSCSGGGGGGVTIGDTGTGTLTLNFANAIDELTLSDFFVRYQSITGPKGTPGSAIGRGTSTSTGSSGTPTSSGTPSTSSTGGTPVPAPAALWLFAAGLAGLGWQFGRRRTTVTYAA